MSSPTMQALLLIKTTTPFTPGPDTYHPAEVTTVPRPSAGEGEVLIKVMSAGFNHRDLFQRQSELVQSSTPVRVIYYTGADELIVSFV